MREHDRDTLRELHEKSQRLKDEAARLLCEARALDERIDEELRCAREENNPQQPPEASS
jgi:hypothetical protein